MEWIFFISTLMICGGTAVVALKARAHARLALVESRKAVAAKDEAEHALISILDEDGNVRSRLALPGEMAKAPNTTPCGDLCALAMFVKDGQRDNEQFSSGTWHCRAGQGAPVDMVRPKFLHNNNCSMFERDDD